MPEKRPFPPGGSENNDPKRARSNNGSPAPGPAAAAAATAAAAAGDDDIARKRREATERIAAFKASRANTASAQPASSSTAAAPALSTTERIAALKAKVAQQHAAPAPIPPAAASSPAPDDRQAAMQARIAAMKARLNSAASPSAPPDINERLAAAKAKAAELSQQSRQKWPNMAADPPKRDDIVVRGGLNVGIHPSLLQQPSQVASRGQQNGKGKQPHVDPAKPRANPYLPEETPQDAAAVRKSDPNYDPSLTTSTTAGKDRKSRQLLFNQKGKFIAQANALRQQQKLEDMRLRMQEDSRKKAIEEATEKSYLVPAPPDCEWWDEGLVVPKTYTNTDFTDPTTTDFSVITAYVQHPPLMTAAQDSLQTITKPMFLTKSEQKKVRRQRRMADHKEEQAKIRLGLKPPPAPKVKKSNLMRVLGQEAVKDPTAVEARVNREIAQRATDHESTNAERALTKEQRHEKLAAQQEADAAKGIHVAVFRIDNLSFSQHRYKISINATQQNLTGICLFNPAFNLVIVEGGSHSVTAYKKLMLNRIKWTENAMPNSVREGNNKEAASEAEFLKATDEQGRLKDLSANRCVLVFEGEEKERGFKRWFPYRVAETDGEAKDLLARSKMENMWTLASGMGEEVWA